MALSASSGKDRVEIVPERGGIVSRLVLGGDEILFMDAASLADPAKNVRGGIPVLFPIAGKLPGGAYSLAGTRYELKQHGFARNKAWRVESADAPIRLVLDSDGETRALYPFDFRASLTFSLRGGTLAIDLRVENRGQTPMPFQAGFHPYFLVSDAAKKEASVETDATRFYDNVTGASGPLSKPIDFTARELDMHLEDHRAKGTTLRRGPARRPVTLWWSDPFSRMVLWTLAGKDFICVEPWTAPGGALASGDPALIRLEPGAASDLRFVISI